MLYLLMCLLLPVLLGLGAALTILALFWMVVEGM